MIRDNGIGWRARFGVFILGCVLLVGCGGRQQMSPELLQHKLDSVKALEIKERLAVQGINLEGSDNPLQQFYDSLELQPLPVSYTEEYVRFLPDFKPVPQEIVEYLELEGHHPRAIALPESLGARLVLLAADETGEVNRFSLWLYSLDDEYMPVDKLCLYALEDEEDEFELEPEEFIQYFSITSDYEIHLLDYTKQAHKLRTQEVYYLDPARKFVPQDELKEKKEN